MLKTQRLPWHWLSPRREIAKNVVTLFLSRIEGAQIELHQGEGNTQTYGDQLSPLKFIIEVRDPCVFERVMRGGTLAAAETYIEGLWKTNNLDGLLLIMAQNLRRLDRLDAQMSKWVSWCTNFRKRLHRNHKAQAKRNILSHYDLGNHFYSSFLDTQMQYSAGIYSDFETDHPETQLEQAQGAKLQRICEQLELNENTHLLEIGSGWGGLAVYAATHYGCKVTTTTISDEQYQYCCALVHRLHLGDQIHVLSRDYRDLSGHYDRLVSIEMIEAVGEEYLPNFIERCSRLLKPGGRMLLQSITIDDARYETYRQHSDFIQQMVFPGGFLPALKILNPLFKKYTLNVENYFEMRLSYAQTLLAWHNKLTQYRQEHPQQLGFNAQFFRLWHFYMSYCRAGFITANTNVWQITLSR